jgi:hypothetical protein
MFGGMQQVVDAIGLRRTAGPVSADLSRRLNERRPQDTVGVAGYDGLGLRKLSPPAIGQPTLC